MVGCRLICIDVASYCLFPTLNSPISVCGKLAWKPLVWVTLIVQLGGNNVGPRHLT